MSGAVAPRDVLAAAHCSVSRRLFEFTGVLGAAGGDAPSAVALSSLSGRFAWHAELWFDLLPVRRDVDREALVSRPVRGADEVLERLGAAAGVLDDLGVCEALAVVVVPRLAAGACEVRGSVDPRLDGPRARAAGLIATDLEDSSSQLAGLVARLASARTGQGAPGALAAACEADLVAAGVGRGLVPTGD